MALRALPQPCSGVAPIVSTILMVAITVVLAAVVFVFVSGILAPPPPPPIAITFSSASVEDGNNSVSITSATGTSRIPSSSLTYVVKDSDSVPYFLGSAGDSMTTNSLNITVHYRDLDSNELVSAGDTLVIEVQPASGASLLDGGVIEIFFGTQQIASHSIAWP